MIRIAVPDFIGVPGAAAFFYIHKFSILLDQICIDLTGIKSRGVFIYLKN
ncbi:uncharacterized protein METZ01_LOCUS118118 [marine metagenome]|uniref:Uncharacterized protein n=1 Tax=marine metagenome TaxID=408172 RepID=A0A381XKH7_9ZZZZ